MEEVTRKSQANPRRCERILYAENGVLVYLVEIYRGVHHCVAEKNHVAGGHMFPRSEASKQASVVREGLGPNECFLEVAESR